MPGGVCDGVREPAMARGCWTGVDGVTGVTGVRLDRISSKPFFSGLSSMLGRADLRSATCERNRNEPANKILILII